MRNIDLKMYIMHKIFADQANNPCGCVQNCHVIRNNTSATILFFKPITSSYLDQLYEI